MNRTVGVLVSAFVAVSAAALPTAASATTKTVYAGPPPFAPKVAGKLGVTKAFANTYNPDINNFFLHRVTINAGDTISFIIDGFHDVDLPGSSGKDLPLIVPGATITGEKDAAGSDFWFDGKLPSLSLNPGLLSASGGHAYSGSTRVDSGLPLGPSKPFKVTFTKPGTYKYFCDVHPGMVGFVVVKPKGKAVPSAKQDAAALTNQLTGNILSAENLAKTKVPAGTVDLGVSDRNGVELYQMFPAKLSVKVGTVLTFSMSRDSRDDHTATFGPLSYLKALSKAFQGVKLPGQDTYPSDPTQPLSLNATSHGNGFASTGILDADPTTTTIPLSGKVKFTQAGTYHYICLIHPFMQGTVVVH